MDFSFGDGVRFVTVRAVRAAGAFAVLVGLLALPGCGDGGLDRYGLSGNVTHKGEPVPAGVINVMADRSKGNKGPGARGFIKDGRYQIRPEKGTISGPVIVVISAGDGKDISVQEGRRLGNVIAEGYKLEAVFEPGNKEMDFEIP